MFFIADYADLAKLTAPQIQEIYCHRNIVVRNAPERQFEWSLETLSELGALKRTREVQGLSLVHHNKFSTDVSTVGECRGDVKVNGMLKTGTLQDVYEHASERVLNCLSLPTSNSEIVFTPGLRSVTFS
jgi:hypothetical protein